MEMSHQKIFIVVNVDWFFLSHRLPIGLAAKDAGYDVTIVCADTGKLDIIKGYGFHVIKLPISRGMSTYFNELKSLLFLIKLYKNISGGIIHHVGLKLILFGSIAHRLSFSKAKIVNALSGAGTLFATENSTNVGLKFLLSVFSFLSRRDTTYIFQNKDDVLLFKNILGEHINHFIIKGAGVDLNEFSFSPCLIKKPYIFLFVGRLLREKGVFEFLKAARAVMETAHKEDCKFVVLGDFDKDNPSGIKEEDLVPYYESIEFVGYSKNVANWIKESFCVILPSYREGLPKSLIEACAVGRPIITTDAIGCRETVKDGQNGFLVPLYSSEAIVERVLELIKDPNQAKKMGLISRILAETDFDVNIICSQTLNVYRRVFEEKVN